MVFKLSHVTHEREASDKGSDEERIESLAAISFYFVGFALGPPNLLNLVKVQNFSQNLFPFWISLLFIRQINFVCTVSGLVL